MKKIILAVFTCLNIEILAEYNTRQIRQIAVQDNLAEANSYVDPEEKPTSNAPEDYFKTNDIVDAEYYRTAYTKIIF